MVIQSITMTLVTFVNDNYLFYIMRESGGVMKDIHCALDTLVETSTTVGIKSKFLKDTAELQVFQVKELKKIFNKSSDFTYRLIMSTLLQCRILLELTDKSKPQDYLKHDITVLYAVKDTLREKIVHIYIQDGKEDLIYKRISFNECLYVLDKKADQQRSVDKAMDTFFKGSTASMVAGSGVVTGTAHIVKGTGQAVAAGAKVSASLVGKQAAGAVTKKGIGTMALGAAGSGVTALGTTAATATAGTALAGVGTAVGTGLTAVGGVLTAPVTAPIVAGVCTAVSLGMFVKSISAMCSHRSKAYRYCTGRNSVTSYTMIKTSDTKVLQNAKNVKGCILCVSEDYWSEGVDLYRMYPIVHKQIEFDELVGLFATTNTGWPQTEEELEKHIKRMQRLKLMILKGDSK